MKWKFKWLHNQKEEETIMKVKAMVVSVIMLIMMMSFSVFAAEDDILLISENPTNEIRVQLDGEYVDFTDEAGNVVNPKIIENRTMVPMRKIFEIFDAEVAWDNTTKTVVATTAEKEITLTINNATAKVKEVATGEEKEITLDSVPVLLENRTMVPVRFIAESLEKEVGWDAENKTVIIIDFDKLTAALKEEVPQLGELFALEVEPTQSFKTSSKITGKLAYQDPKSKSNNETIAVDGTLTYNQNKEQEKEIYLDLDFSGKGTIFDSLKEAGYETMKLGFLITKENAYMMMELEGEQLWLDVTDSFEDLETQLVVTGVVDASVTSYEDLVEMIKTAMGELNDTSYAQYQVMIAILKAVFANDSFKITGTDSKKTVSFKISVQDFLQDLFGDVMTEDGDFDIEVAVEEEIVNHKVSSGNIHLDFAVTEPTSKESFDMDFDIAMKFSNLNEDFQIALPEDAMVISE